MTRLDSLTMNKVGQSLGEAVELAATELRRVERTPISEPEPASVSKPETETARPSKPVAESIDRWRRV